MVESEAVELDGKTLIAPPPFVEVELVYEAARAGVTSEGWCALEVWTQNHVYEVDWGMRCFAVRDARTRAEQTGHRLVGALLTGGQHRGGGSLELSFPLPRPGNSAVFEVGEPPRVEYVTTTEVSRVVLRLRVMSIPEDEDSSPSWKRLSGAFRATRRGHGAP